MLLKPNGFSWRTTSSIIRLLVRFYRKITDLFLEYAFCEESKSAMGIFIAWLLEIFGLFFGWAQWGILRSKNWIEPNFIHLLGCSYLRNAFIKTITVLSMSFHFISPHTICDFLKVCESACAISANGYSIRYFISLYWIGESCVHDLWREKETNGQQG